MLDISQSLLQSKGHDSTRALEDIVISAVAEANDVTRLRIKKPNGDLVYEQGPAVSDFSVTATSPILIKGNLVGNVEASTGGSKPSVYDARSYRPQQHHRSGRISWA